MFFIYGNFIDFNEFRQESFLRSFYFFCHFIEALVCVNDFSIEIPCFITSLTRGVDLSGCYQVFL